MQTLYDAMIHRVVPRAINRQASSGMPIHGRIQVIHVRYAQRRQQERSRKRCRIPPAALFVSHRHAAGPITGLGFGELPVVSVRHE